MRAILGFSIFAMMAGKLLGLLKAWKTPILGFSIFAMIVGVPLLYRSLESVRYRNFRVVKDGELLRSGDLSPVGLARLAEEYKIGTIVNLRNRKDESGQNDDQDEHDFCQQHGIAFHRISPADWSPVDGKVPGDETVRQFLRIMDDPNTRKPVLIHCFAGIHRTGAHVATYRIEFDGWTGPEAIREMESMGTVRTTFAPNLLEYLTNYQRGRLRTPPAKAPATVGDPPPNP